MPAVFHAIAQNIAGFASFDEGRWRALRELFHAKATIAVSWYDGGIDGFVEAWRSLAGPPNLLTKHRFGLPRIEARGGRALSETDVAIGLRCKVGGLELDVSSDARFFDRFVRCDDGRWRCFERTAIYEKDRLDPVRPSFLFPLLYREARFAAYPAECRHVAFVQEKHGLRLARIVAAQSDDETALKAAGRRWLESPIAIPNSNRTLTVR